MFTNRRQFSWVAILVMLPMVLLCLAVSVKAQDAPHVYGAKTATPYTVDDYLYGRKLLYNMYQQRSSPNNPTANATGEVEPFRIAGNTYFVGVAGNGAYLITTTEGHILMEQPYEKAGPSIAKSIEKLGFKLSDIKILTATEAHGDHVGATAYFKKLTGAPVMLMEGDVKMMESGQDGGYPGVKVDRVLRDRDQIKLGDTVITAYNIPNHTQGSTTFVWQVVENGQKYNMAETCCWSNYQRDLVSDPKTIPALRHTFETLKSLPVDIPTPGGHTDHFDMYGKLAKLRANPAVNPWIAPQDYRGVIAYWEWAFEQEVLKQLKEGPPPAQPARGAAPAATPAPGARGAAPGTGAAPAATAPRAPSSFPPFPDHP
jgi:metallo-beta-lactamase class B